MTELKEGQQIIFKHPESGKVTLGVIRHGEVIYMYYGNAEYPNLKISELSEWYDASEAWNALTLQNVRAGTFEWNEGLTVEPKTI